MDRVGGVCVDTILIVRKIQDNIRMEGTMTIGLRANNDGVSIAVGRSSRKERE